MKRRGVGLVLVLLCLVASCDDGGDSTPAATDGFKSIENWSAVNAGATGGLDTRGYFGVVYDGRYIYYVPVRTILPHGVVLRYDTLQPFNGSGSWASYDAGKTDGLASVGYAGAAYDGRYIYYAPFISNEGRHARVLRLDTRGDFTSSSSWSAYDAAARTGGKLGYNGVVFDGRYVYFTPYGYPPDGHGVVLRLDPRGDFHADESWAAYNAGSTGGLNTRGYYGQAFDGRYIYFAPFNDGSIYHGRVLRYDTRGGFADSSNWQAYDARITSGLATVGYKGATFDGRYVYFVPFRDEQDAHGRVLRLDTVGAFADPESWSAHDAWGIDGLDTKGFVGAAFDGRYTYFCPFKLADGDYHGNFLRYDGHGDFMDDASWAAFQPGTLNGLVIKGYKGVLFDGTYLHFSPYDNGIAYSGIALRYRPTE